MSPTAPSTLHAEDPDEFYTTKELAARINCGIQTLHQMRSQGRGPKFIKGFGRPGKTGGRVLYRWKDVEVWLETHTVDPSAKTA